MLFTIVGMEAFPARAGPGAADPTLTVGLPVVPVPRASAIPAPAAPPMRAATNAMTSQRGAPEPDAGPGAGSGGGGQAGAGTPTRGGAP